jgi:hypothetical protein
MESPKTRVEHEVWITKPPIAEVVGSIRLLFLPCFPSPCEAFDHSSTRASMRAACLDSHITFALATIRVAFKWTGSVIASSKIGDMCLTGMIPSTTLRMVALLRSSFGALHFQNWLTNPAQQACKTSRRKKRVEAVSVQNFVAVIAWIKDM